MTIYGEDPHVCYVNHDYIWWRPTCLLCKSWLYMVYGEDPHVCYVNHDYIWWRPTCLLCKSWLYMVKTHMFVM